MVDDPNEKDRGTTGAKGKLIEFTKVRERKAKAGTTLPRGKQLGAAGTARRGASASRGEAVQWKKKAFTVIQFVAAAFVGWIVLKSCGG